MGDEVTPHASTTTINELMGRDTADVRTHANSEDPMDQQVATNDPSDTR